MVHSFTNWRGGVTGGAEAVRLSTMEASSALSDSVSVSRASLRMLTRYLAKLLPPLYSRSAWLNQLK